MKDSSLAFIEAWRRLNVILIDARSRFGFLPDWGFLPTSAMLETCERVNFQGIAKDVPRDQRGPPSWEIPKKSPVAHGYLWVISYNPQEWGFTAPCRKIGESDLPAWKKHHTFLGSLEAPKTSPKDLQTAGFFRTSCWRFNHPFEKYESNWIISPGVKIKKWLKPPPRGRLGYCKWSQ